MFYVPIEMTKEYVRENVPICDNITMILLTAF